MFSFFGNEACGILGTSQAFSQSLSRLWLFATPWTAARQASLSITNSRSPPKPMSIESVMPSNHIILCRPLLLPPSILPSIRVFSNESVSASGGQSTGASASASVLLMNIKDWFPLGFPRWLTGKIICLQCRRHGLDPWVRMIPWRREWHSSILAWKIPRTENLAGYTPQGHKESDTTEHIDT